MPAVTPNYQFVSIVRTPKVLQVPAMEYLLVGLNNISLQSQTLSKYLQLQYNMHLKFKKRCYPNLMTAVGIKLK